VDDPVRDRGNAVRRLGERGDRLRRVVVADRRQFQARRAGIDDEN
jgi:hypothetical protein